MGDQRLPVESIERGLTPTEELYRRELSPQALAAGFVRSDAQISGGQEGSEPQVPGEAEAPVLSQEDKEIRDLIERADEIEKVEPGSFIAGAFRRLAGIKTEMAERNAARRAKREAAKLAKKKAAQPAAEQVDEPKPPEMVPADLVHDQIVDLRTEAKDSETPKEPITQETEEAQPQVGVEVEETLDHEEILERREEETKEPKKPQTKPKQPKKSTAKAKTSDAKKSAAPKAAKSKSTAKKSAKTAKPKSAQQTEEAPVVEDQPVEPVIQEVQRMLEKRVQKPKAMSDDPVKLVTHKCVASRDQSEYGEQLKNYLGGYSNDKPVFVGIVLPGWASKAELIKMVSAIQAAGDLPYDFHHRLGEVEDQIYRSFRS